MIVVKLSADGTRIDLGFSHRRWVATWMPTGPRLNFAALRPGTLKSRTIHEGSITGVALGTVGESVLANSRIGVLTRRLSMGADPMEFDDGRDGYDWKGSWIALRWK